MTKQKQQSLTANRLASIEREMDIMTHDSSEGLRATIYLYHARQEYAAGNYGVAEMDLVRSTIISRSSKEGS